MATKSISQLDTQATANETDLFEVAIVDANSASGYASKKESAAAIADAIVGEYQYPLRITGTTAKTIAGAINELKNLVDLLPQFAIEVVQTLPVSDISETTIYLVPASDPEQGNYYEEYIYVNNAWELVGTTAVDLSGYYTSAQVDTLLAAKADSSSLATVATSGAYSDLMGKPTIDTALDDTSTNAVENRAVASEINSIKSDITVEGSASGDIASFVDGSDNPLKALTISIVATQSGSGDPSPTNVRPISGFSAVDVTRTGKNLFDPVNYSDFLQEDDTYEGTGSAVNRVKNTLPAQLVGKNLTFSCYIDNTTGPSAIYLMCVTGTNIYRSDSILYGSAGYLSLSVFANQINETSYFQITYALNGGNTFKFKDMQLEIGNTATAYEPNNGNTYNIDWQSTAGTVYGGTHGVLNGLLSNKYTKRKLSDLTWTKGNRNNNDTGYIYYANCVGPSNRQGISTMYKRVNLLNSWEMLKLYECCFNQYYWIICDDSEDVATLKATRGDAEVVYESNTPQIYQLTPVEIRSLLGQNNIWADCGAITELKYTRDLNLCINDIIARIEALEGASSTRSLSVSPVLTKSIVSDSDTAEGKTEETEEETKEEAQNER